MPKRKFALEPGGPKRVEVSWKGFWKGITVKLDGEVIGIIANKKELMEGRQFTLPDGTLLSVQMAKTFLSVQLKVMRNGQPLPGSDADPGQQLKLAYGIIFFIAGLNILLGLYAVLSDNTFLTNEYGIDWTTIVFGVVFLLLGFLVKGRSSVALALAIAIFIAGSIWSFYVIAQFTPGQTLPVGAIVIRIFMLIAMFQGFKAIRELQAPERQTTTWPR